jgi:hypothetical protein
VRRADAELLATRTIVPQRSGGDGELEEDHKEESA